MNRNWEAVGGKEGESNVDRTYNSARTGRKSSRRFATNILKLINLIFNSVSRIQIPELFFLTISYKMNKNDTFRVITMVIHSLLKGYILLPSF